MNDVRLAMLQSLVAVAWADEELHEKELSVLEKLIETCAFDAAEASAIREFARTPRSLADVPATKLSLQESRSLLQGAVWLSYADGWLDHNELHAIDQLVSRLGMSLVDAAPLLAAAHARARRLGPWFEQLS